MSAPRVVFAASFAALLLALATQAAGQQTGRAVFGVQPRETGQELEQERQQLSRRESEQQQITHA